VGITLTVLAAVGCARAQQPANPCAAGNFNPKACRSAIRLHGYCDGATWTPQEYQRYSYYHGLYRKYVKAGGIVTPAPAGACQPPVTNSRGFGSTGAALGQANS